METAIISAGAAIAVAALSVFLTKWKERQTDWRAKRLAFYEEFFAAASGIVGDITPPDAKIRFATSVNNLHLIAPQSVLEALHSFCDEIAQNNPSRSRDRHDELWSSLVWQIRNDLGGTRLKPLSQFRARLWASGVGTNVKAQ